MFWPLNMWVIRNSGIWFKKKIKKRKQTYNWAIGIIESNVFKRYLNSFCTSRFKTLALQGHLWQQVWGVTYILQSAKASGLRFLGLLLGLALLLSGLGFLLLLSDGGLYGTKLEKLLLLASLLPLSQPLLLLKQLRKVNNILHSQFKIVLRITVVPGGIKVCFVSTAS